MRLVFITVASDFIGIANGKAVIVDTGLMHILRSFNKLVKDNYFKNKLIKGNYFNLSVKKRFLLYKSM